jgi:hypothetical protein
MRHTSKWHFVRRFPSWGPLTLCADLRLRWGLKQSCSPRWELFKGMFHVTCMQRNQVDSWLLMVRSQIANLTCSPSFGHNLCFKCPNGSCELILDIYVPKPFQWYKELFSPLNFNLCNYLLKIWKSTKTPSPKVGVALGVWGFIFIHSGSIRCDSQASSWSTTLQALLPWSRT